MKKDKRYKKLTAEGVQQLLAMRKKGYTQKNAKAYNRKQKHKNQEKD